MHTILFIFLVGLYFIFWRVKERERNLNISKFLLENNTHEDWRFIYLSLVKNEEICMNFRAKFLTERNMSKEF